MKQQQFKGTGVALVTPFKEGKIDFENLEKVIEHVIEGGVDFLVTLGTTGESVTLNSEERRAVIDFTIKINNGRKPIVVGSFGGNNTSHLVQRIKDFNFEGIDAIMSSVPSYNKPTDEGIFQHYMAIEKVSPLPIILYNVPGRTATNMSAQTTLRLARTSEKFIAVKEASGDMQQVQDILKHRPDHFLVLSGEDPITLAMMACGSDGGISVIANALPKQFSDMIRAALNEDYVAARALNLLLHDVHPWLYVEGNPAGVKAALELQRICSREVRLPLVPFSEALLVPLRDELNRVLVNQ
jgi:4-hydroxy-tetrahydrodipicolinate synthase